MCSNVVYGKEVEFSVVVHYVCLLHLLMIVFFQLTRTIRGDL